MSSAKTAAILSRSQCAKWPVVVAMGDEEMRNFIHTSQWIVCYHLYVECLIEIGLVTNLERFNT